MTLTTAEIEKKLGIPSSTLKLWEQEFGIFVPRGSRNRRAYSEEYLELFAEIRRLREQMCGTAEIRERISSRLTSINAGMPAMVSKTPTNSAVTAEMFVMLREKDQIIRELYEKIGELQHEKEIVDQESNRIKAAMSVFKELLSTYQEVKENRQSRSPQRFGWDRIQQAFAAVLLENG